MREQRKEFKVMAHSQSHDAISHCQLLYQILTLNTKQFTKKYHADCMERKAILYTVGGGGGGREKTEIYYEKIPC